MRLLKFTIFLVLSVACVAARALSCASSTDEETIKEYDNILVVFITEHYGVMQREGQCGTMYGRFHVIEVLKGCIPISDSLPGFFM